MVWQLTILQVAAGRKVAAYLGTGGGEDVYLEVGETAPRQDLTFLLRASKNEGSAGRVYFVGCEVRGEQWE